MTRADPFVLCRSSFLRALDPWLHASGRFKPVKWQKLSSTATKGPRSRKRVLAAIACRPHRRSLTRTLPRLYIGADRREALQSQSGHLQSRMSFVRDVYAEVSNQPVAISLAVRILTRTRWAISLSHFHARFDDDL
jgi:hypothetical protein